MRYFQEGGSPEEKTYIENMSDEGDIDIESDVSNGNHIFDEENATAIALVAVANLPDEKKKRFEFPFYCRMEMTRIPGLKTEVQIMVLSIFRRYIYLI